jgi:hypothetical protein
VKSHRDRWNTYLQNHQPRVGTTLVARQAARQRMLADNPMRRPEVAQRVGAANRGKDRRSSEAKARAATAARKRMRSGRNPMRSAAVRQKVMEKVIGYLRQSKFEKRMEDCFTRMELPVIYTGSGERVFWIGRKVPDFRVTGQKKIIEVTQRGVFNSRFVPRTLTGYARPLIRHYLRSGWQCLVIFFEGRSLPQDLSSLVQQFVSPDSNWSGAWHFGQFLTSDELTSLRASTTSRAIQSTRTRPTVS